MAANSSPKAGVYAPAYLLENAPNAIVVVARNGQIRYVNDSASRLFVGDPGFLTGSDIGMLLAVPGEYERMAGVFYDAGEAAFPEIELHRADGDPFWARIIWKKTDADGTGKAALWIDEIAAGDHLDRTVSGLFDAAPLPMMLCATEDATVLHANKRAAELFAGRGGGQISALNDILGDETTALFLHNIHNGGFIDDFEVMLNTAYGEQYCGTVSGQLLTLAGRRCMVVGMNDITDRKQAEEALRRFFDGAPLGMLLVRERDLRVLRINRRASELIAHDRNSNAAALEMLLGVEATGRFLAELREGGFVDAFECVLATGWDENIWTNLSGQNIEIDDERCILIGLTDITELKRWEQELRAAKEEAELATRAKSQFLATMSHEIRTPMNGVLGMIEVLSNTAMTTEQKDMVSVISDSARTLLTIIDDILDLSKIEADRMTLEKIPMSLRKTVETTVELVAPPARGKGVEVGWWVAPAIPDIFLGDPTRLRQILLNLLSNAVKFTDRGRVVVRVEWQSDAILFEIEDTGIGMSPEQQQQLFKPFSQADTSTTRRFGGTGLGLAICKRLVDMMGGQIVLRSTVGTGSCFSFAIPFVEAPQQPDRTGAILRDIRILLADPLTESRRCIADSLKAQGALVVEIAEQRDFTAAFADPTAFDGVLIDASFDPAPLVGESPLPPVLVLSAYTDESASGTFARQWGKTNLPVLAKPARRAALIRAVAIAVGRVSRDSPAESRGQPLTARLGRLSELPILIAEDNHTNRIVIAKQLDCLGISYDMAEDGEVALAALAAKSYVLLLADCHMPRMDGYTLTRRLRDAEKRSGKHLPVIALTANALSGDRESCLAAGMDDYLAKPVTLANLETVLRRWLPQPAGEEAGVSLSPSDTTPRPAAPAPTAQDSSRPMSTAPSTPTPAVDCAALAELLGTDSAETRALVLQSFVEFFPELLERARSAIESRNRAALRSAAHAAKGAARSACASRLADILLHLEGSAAGRTAFSRLAQSLTAAAAAYAEVEDFVADDLKRP
ncbi:ATP-binding protein [Telmatospirillum sp.]|uniref:ATP-binding protein n=1 Tax=Telmatospirillum sp. TaxID=2079197 RepID=UPI00283E3839|nr:ATP-binding protein [Telmatospirillum sp.]MDR3438064.1 ATP-binding protein [Telmatospirillum sp.]